MDWLRACGTATQTQHGWTAIQFEVYATATQDCTISPISANDNNDEQDKVQSILTTVKTAEALRRSRYIADIDQSTSYIWVFLPAVEQSQFANTTPVFADVFESSEFAIHERYRGNFHSSDLVTRQSMLRSAEIIVTEHNEKDGVFDDSVSALRIIDVYAKFIAAINASLTYRIASSSSYVPLSSSILLSSIDHKSTVTQQRAPGYVTAVGTSTYLTGAGILVTSRFPIRGLNILSLPHASKTKSSVKRRILLLAPISILATPAILAHDASPPSLDTAWSQVVVAWLAEQGVCHIDLDVEQWTCVQVSGEDGSRLSSAQESGKKFLWPTKLCYIYDSERVLDSKRANADDRELDSQQSSFDDLLRFSELWSQSHDSRIPKPPGYVDGRTNQTSVVSPEHHSPAHNRSITYGDVHGGAGVYPTPPDGLAGLPTAQPNLLAPSPLQSSDVSDMPLKHDSSDSRTTNRNLKRSNDSHDDLFDDDFESNDITDADFSFFDAADDAFTAQVDGESHLKTQSAAEDFIDLHVPTTDDQMPAAGTVDDLAIEASHEVDNEAQGCEDTIQVRSLDPREVLHRLFQGGPVGQGGQDAKGGSFSSVTFSDTLHDFEVRYDVHGPFGFPSSADSVKKRHSPDTTADLPIGRSRKRPARGKLDQSTRRRTRDTTNATSDDDSDSILSENHASSFAIFTDADATGLDLATTSSEANQHTAQDIRAACHASWFLELVASGASDASIQHLRSRMRRAQTLATNQPSKFASTFSNFTNGFVALSQLLTDQFQHDVSVMGLPPIIQGDRSLICGHELVSVNAVHNVAVRLFTAVTENGESESALMRYASIQDPSVEQQAGLKPVPQSSQAKGPNKPLAAGFAGVPLLISSQFVRIRRNDAMWHMRAPAIAFWDVLGLAPTNGPKSISAFTLFPNMKGLDAIASQLVDDIGQCYENARLGKHIHDKPGPDLPLDFTSFQTEDGQTSKSFTMQCVKIGKRLAWMDHDRSHDRANKEKTSDAAVNTRIIYAINPFKDPSILHNIVHGFMALREAYRRERTSAAIRKPHVILKVLVLARLSVTEGIVLQDNPTLQMLAREVYNRCPMADALDESGALPINSHSSIQLMEATPRKIAFELTADPPSNIMQDPSHLHVGYSTSESGNWITAAFTDNAGRYQATVSYCLTGSRRFLDIAREIWQTCIDLMKSRRVNWRLHILKVGYMTSSELEVWASLASTTQSFTLLTLIYSLDLEPPMSLLPPVLLPLAPPTTANIRNNAQTPTGTPKTPAGVSPDPSAQTPAAGTPSEHANAAAADAAANDPDAHLVDMTDETYAIMIGHRIILKSSGMSSTHDFLQALSTALVVRVPPTTATSNPFNLSEILEPNIAPCIAVHLLWARNALKSASATSNTGAATDTPPSTPGGNPTTPAMGNPSAVPKAASDNILREAVTHLRNLALLAKLRGIKDGMTGLVPWHALVAQRAVDGLDSVYGLQRWSSMLDDK